MVSESLSIEDTLPAVYQGLRRSIHGVLSRYRVPVEDAEDLVQDALLALVTSWAEIREPDVWLIGAVRHLCRLYVRRQRRSKVVRVDVEHLERLAGGVPSGEERHGARCEVERLMRELTPQQQRLLRLSFGLGLDAHELAERLGGAKPESLRRARFRALVRLRELVAGERQGPA